MGNRLNNRRRYVLALAAGVLAKPLGPFAQPTSRIVRIGVLVPGSRAFFMNRFDAFVGGLKALGYVEGKNLAFEYRYADGKSERLLRPKLSVAVYVCIISTLRREDE